MTKKSDRERFNAPFARMKDRLAPAKPAPPPPPPRPAAPPAPREPSNDELWARALEGVKPVNRGPDLARPAAPRAATAEFWHPDLDALKELEALVSGEAPFDLADTDEYIEGRLPGLDPAIVRRLRKGEFAVQDHIDLHGLTREEAKGAVDRFLKAARTSGKRCVLLVHGRGLHSRDQVPVLKEALRTWLATARFGRHVLAFATARPADGGGGAIYVLLRKPGR